MTVEEMIHELWMNPDIADVDIAKIQAKLRAAEELADAVDLLKIEKSERVIDIILSKLDKYEDAGTI